MCSDEVTEYFEKGACAWIELLRWPFVVGGCLNMRGEAMSGQRACREEGLDCGDCGRLVVSLAINQKAQE